jgi:hypothetical protein
MSDNRSIFHDEWRACLHAHYLHVIRTGDSVTEPTLRHVLLQAGLSPEEVSTMQTDARTDTDVEPAARTDTEIEPVVQVEADDLAEDVVIEEAAVDEPPAVDADAWADTEDDEPPPDSPAQLSLF